MSNLRTALHLIDRAFDSHNEGADMDAGFDAGEFSAPAHWRAFQQDADQIARRCGFTGVDAVYQRAAEVDAMDENVHSVLMAAMEVM